MNEPGKNLILLRGLPGSGKTTLAHILSEALFPCFSVDDFFTDPQTGKYSFDFSQNHLAYKNCEANVENEMKKNSAKIFVHNTFTMQWEMKPYFELANKYSYTVFVITVENRHGKKNVHDIPEDQIKKMAEKYSVELG